MLRDLTRRLAGERLIVISLAFSLIGTASLAAFSVPEARKVDIGDISDEHIGSTIVTEGRIRDVSMGYRLGDLVVTLLDLDTSAALIVTIKERCILSLSEESRNGLGSGAVVRVEGKLSSYKGAYRLSVEGAGALEIVAPSDAPVALSTVLAMPMAFEGANLTFVGTVMDKTRVANLKMKLVTDGSLDLWIYVESMKSVYGSADVSGMFFYDEARARWSIKVTEGTQDRYVPHPSTLPSGYENVTLDALLSSPQGYEGKLVSLENVRALTHDELLGASFLLREGDFSAHCMLFSSSIDLARDGRIWNDSSVVRFSGKFGYYEENGEWQLVADSNDAVELIA